MPGKRLPIFRGPARRHDRPRMAAEIVEGALLRPDGSFAPARLEIRDGVVVAREDGGSGTQLVAPGMVDLQVNGAAGVSVTEGAQAIARDRRGDARRGRDVVARDGDDDRRRDRGRGRCRRAAPSTSKGRSSRRSSRARTASSTCACRPTACRPYFEHRVRAPGDARARAAGRRRARAVARRARRRRLARALGRLAGAGRATCRRAWSRTSSTRCARRTTAGRRWRRGRWSTDSVAIGLIPDGVHVDPLVLKLVRRLAGDRVVLVSDASAATAARGRVHAPGHPDPPRRRRVPQRRGRARRQRDRPGRGRAPLRALQRRVARRGARRGDVPPGRARGYRQHARAGRAGRSRRARRGRATCCA